jgi:hypothetical protein
MLENIFQVLLKNLKTGKAKNAADAKQNDCSECICSMGYDQKAMACNSRARGQPLPKEISQ